MIRIECKDGNPANAKITDLATGADLMAKGIPAEGIVITIKVGEMVRASITPVLWPIGLEIDVTKAEWRTANPATGRIEPLAALIFRDGTQVDFLADGGHLVKPAS